VSLLDPRLLRVSIQIGSNIKTYSDIAISVSGSKFANATQNECELKLTNLDKATRDYLLTNASPFSKSKTRKSVIVEAGRESTGYAIVFVGDITTTSGGPIKDEAEKKNPKPSTTTAQPPDITITLKAATTNYNKGQVIAVSQPPSAPLQNIAKQVADSLGLTLDFQATPRNISSYSYTGSKARQVEKLGQMGRVNAYVDDNVLVVKDFGKPLRNKVKVLNLDTGLIGVPEFTEHGIRVKMLFDNQVTLGSGLQITSKINPAANGVYTVYKLNFELTNRDTPFYYIAECNRNG
jgi:hypothetical protein